MTICFNYLICTSQNWHVCGCDMHQHQAIATFWTFVSSSLGGSVPAAELVTLWRLRSQREADLRESAASWNPLRARRKWYPALQLITTWEQHLSEMAGQTHTKHTRDAVTHTRHTNTLWLLPQLPWQCHNSCVWTENQVLHLKAQLGLSSVTWI